jgi:hypothetical protein
MIISHRHRFVFFHNPKVGGTSVRTTLERFNDIGFGLWGADAAQTGSQVDRAHLGIAEFAGLYPALWQQVQGYDLFSLCRDPVARFSSSMAEYSKHHGAVDTRFAPPAARKRALFDMIARLDRLGRAEAVLDDPTLTHFRPQWIYWSAPDLAPDLAPEIWPLARIDGFFERVSAIVGEPLQPETVKQRETLALPGPVAGLASMRPLKRLLQVLPGGAAAKALIRRQFSGGRAGDDGFALTPVETAQVAAFVRGFYARDFALWPVADAPPKISA